MVFNVRVYGILISEAKEVLVADEFRFGRKITKFPGGGLEFGEGTIDCLKRECREELGQDIRIIKHFYTTDFFQVSVFNSNHQIISIYYLISVFEPPKFHISSKKFDFVMEEGAESFRWVAVGKLSPEDFTLPIDKKVAEMIRIEFSREPGA